MCINDMELTDEQIERQDYVDNAIFSLICDVNPSDTELEWDIELIGNVRDAIQNELVSRKVCTAQEFYPEMDE